MQQTQYYDAGQLKQLREFFRAPDGMQLVERMEPRLRVLKGKGHTFVRQEMKIPRNSLCRCGSGKKFKKCCIPR